MVRENVIPSTPSSNPHHGNTIDLKRLQAPFPADDIEWRAQRSGIKNGSGWVSAIAYINNRAVQDRLDDVVGPENWKDEYDTSPVGGVLCGISIRINGEWVTKWDGADKTDIEPIKGGLSNSEKRAAVKWGIGRYLYKLEAKYVKVLNDGDIQIKIWEYGKDKRKDPPKIVGYWSPPKLPDWALPIAVSSSNTDTPLKAPSMAGLITGTEEAPSKVEDPPRGSQLIKIKTLYAKSGGDAAKRDQWIMQIKTQAQAAQAIELLESAIERQQADNE